MYKYVCNRCQSEQDQAFQCGVCGWRDLYLIKLYQETKVDPSYDADFPAGTKWYDWAISGIVIGMTYPLILVGRLTKRLFRR